ncbi:hypothetical protein MP478_08305 [Chryseobacterium sp. WG14]|uniref:terpene synthase family protein n=1 Tax=Chryseobacterium sp. WG14 TaxID=2926909 RepID=UPI00211DCEF9|nr:hypothetical protein [Chryseobacterium sp. WG14]MCQ9639391.1 hypothetical protein [Chryseobacterium sp. WG14]
MKQKDISVLQYPWPYEIGPFSQSFYEEQNGWIDTDYLFMSEVARTKYKNQGLVETASYMFPAASSKELVRPMARFIVWLTLFDDYHKLCPVHQLADIRDHIMDVMMGQKPRADDIGLIRQVALSREELLPYVNDDWFHRWTKDFYNFTTYGMMEEIPYRLKKQFPALDTLLLVCEYSISIYPYVNLVEPSINFIIPNFISEHPVIKRLKMLMCRIITIQNDFSSWERGLAVDTEVLNIILVLRDQYKISLEEACAEVRNIHDQYVNEFIGLQNNVPDFGLHQKNVARFVHNMALMISGMGAWHHKEGAVHYKIPNEFPQPEYGTSV